jgi:myo-inositol-1(or 4)-monophosphatase
MHLKSCHLLSSVDGMTPHTTPTITEDDRALLAAVTTAAQEAGAQLLEVYSPQARPASRQDLFAAGRRNEEVSLAVLTPALAAARPGARWVGDDQETTTLPPGEWWSVDAVEGNVNHVHGRPEWCVSIALIRDGVPALAVVRQPAGDLTYTAVRGGGAFVNSQPLHTSAKTSLDAAIVVTGQAEAGQDDTYRRIGESITAMLSRALLVRATVPSTFPLLDVAAGQADVFWQYEPVLPGIAPGALLVTEAGGIVTDLRGEPWTPGAPDVLAAAPALHAAALDVLGER